MDRFVCETRREFRSACTGLPFYAEDDGRRYCVLHFPSRAKMSYEEFDQTVSAKLESQDLDFAGVYFPDFHDFASREFQGYARFYGAKFVDGADFSNAIFEGTANFFETSFGAWTNKNTVFSYASFKEDGSFVRTRFERDALFSFATFEEEADFSECRFSRNVEFFRTTFQGMARFYGEKTFNPRQVTDFRFLQITEPDLFHFYAVSLRPSWFINMDARKPNFTDVRWYALPGGVRGTRGEEIKALEDRRRDEGEGTLISDPHALLADACRELSLNYEDNHSYEEANRFYYLAQEAERIKGLWRGFKPLRLRWWYWLLSGYSVYPLLASLWIVIAWLGFVNLYLWLLELDFRQAAAFSINGVTRQRVPGLDANSPTGKALQENEFLETATILVSIEGIIGPLLIALLLLALRRRFMR